MDPGQVIEYGASGCAVTGDKKRHRTISVNIFEEKEKWDFLGKTLM